MKQKLLLTLSLFALVALASTTAQTIWDGPDITFSKPANADWNLEENQDRITDNVWITRKGMWHIFNIAVEDITSDPNCTGSFPGDTEWAFGTTADGVENLTFTNFIGVDFADCSPGSVVGQDAVLHLISEDIYIDIRFNSWGSGGSNGGGAFSYTRSSDPNALSIEEVEAKQAISITPNPAQSTLQITGIESLTPVDFQIYSITGAQMVKGTFVPTQAINVDALPAGVYYLQVGQNGQIAKFLKN
ncbi:MAG: T9SS type A sorting domain-containing protein [Bacteroidota bacterium]